MKEIAQLTFEEVRYLWRNLAKWEGRSFNLFIDSPFCFDQCSFCIYSSTKTRVGSVVYDKYYLEYLPRLLEKFHDVIAMKPLDAVYFGGGTSTLMSSKVMEDLFARIPDFGAIPYKNFECNPGTTSFRKLEILKKNKFVYISFGLQTFNRSTLSRVNRIMLNEQKLKKLIDFAQSEPNRLYVNVDLLAFIDLDKRSLYACLQQFEADLKRLMEEYGPDVITVYPMYQRLANDESDYKMIRALRQAIYETSMNNQDYVAFNMSKMNVSDYKDIMSNRKMNYYISKSSLGKWQKTRRYNSSGFERSPKWQNTLGLGGFKGRSPYSYLGRGYFYEIQNDNWEPKYLLYRGQYPFIDSLG